MTLFAYGFSPWLTPVRVVSTSNLAGTYYNGPTNSGVGAQLIGAASTLTIDSVVMVNGDRVLLQAQTSAFQNGIYVVSGIGSSWILKRSDDFDGTEGLKVGQYVTVGAGTVNAGSAFVLVEPLPAAFGNPIVSGQNNITWTASPLNSGLGTIASQNANLVAITGGAITGITDLAVADGGTGASTGPLALTAFGVKRATTAAYGGGGTSNAYTATGLASTDIVVASILASTNAVSICKVVPTTNVLTITFSADPGAGTTVQWHALPA